jgi:hypothetical protein
LAVAAAAIISVANQPITFNLFVMTKRPMMSVRAAINIMTIMTGTEMTPLMTALVRPSFGHTQRFRLFADVVQRLAVADKGGDDAVHICMPVFACCDALEVGLEI